MTQKRKKEQKKLIEKAETELGLGPVALAEAMGLPYMTYKDFKSGRRLMRPIHEKVISMLRALQGTPAGEEFGV